MKGRNIFGRMWDGVRRFFASGPAVNMRKNETPRALPAKIGLVPQKRADRKYRKSYGYRHGVGGGADRRKRGTRCNARAAAKRRQGWRS